MPLIYPHEMAKSSQDNAEPATRPKWLASACRVLLGAGLLGAVALSRHYSYLLFHAIAETFSVVIGFAIFVVAWNARKFLEKNTILLFLGISVFFVTALDFVHTLAYKGMGVFPDVGSDVPTQLWISARYLGAASFVIAPLFANRPLKIPVVITAYSLAFVLLILSIFVFHNFPDCYVANIGLTRFKVVSEFIICAMLACAILLFVQVRSSFEPYILKLILASLVVSIASEFLFTKYVGVYDNANMLGHLLKIVAFYLLYEAVVITGIKRPQDLLYRKLRLSEAELAERSHRLEAANRELDAFASAISHDLKTPLTTIEGYAGLMLEDGSHWLTPSHRIDLEHIREATRRMAEMIDKLLNFSRVGRATLIKTDVDLSKTAETIAAQLREQQPTRGVKFQIEPNVVAYADEGLLYIVLQNLLGNSWKFTQTREHVLIEFGRAQSTVNDHVAFFVRDNGVGFDSSKADRLFNVFERLDSQFKGTGIGLSTVKRIIQQHEGCVWAESRENEGATFYFTLGTKTPVTA